MQCCICKSRDIDTQLSQTVVRVIDLATVALVGDCEGFITLLLF